MLLSYDVVMDMIGMVGSVLYIYDVVIGRIGLVGHDQEHGADRAFFGGLLVADPPDELPHFWY